MSKGRKKEFDEIEVLIPMTHVFWEKGYDATSYDDLVKATGVQRYGLYSSFGDKRSVFVRCLRHYVSNVVTEYTKPLRAHNASLKEVLDYLSGVLEAQNQEPSLGCLICNSINERVSRDDEDIQRSIKGMFNMLRESLSHALENAKAAKEIPENIDIAIETNQIIATMVGATSIGRAGLDKQILRDSIKVSCERLAK